MKKKQDYLVYIRRDIVDYWEANILENVYVYNICFKVTHIVSNKHAYIPVFILFSPKKSYFESKHVLWFRICAAELDRIFNVFW